MSDPELRPWWAMRSFRLGKAQRSYSQLREERKAVVEAQDGTARKAPRWWVTAMLVGGAFTLATPIIFWSSWFDSRMTCVSSEGHEELSAELSRLGVSRLKCTPTERAIAVVTQVVGSLWFLPGGLVLLPFTPFIQDRSIDLQWPHLALLGLVGVIFYTVLIHRLRLFLYRRRAQATASKEPT